MYKHIIVNNYSNVMAQPCAFNCECLAPTYIRGHKAYQFNTNSSCPQLLLQRSPLAHAERNSAQLNTKHQRIALHPRVHQYSVPGKTNIAPSTSWKYAFDNALNECKKRKYHPSTPYYTLITSIYFVEIIHM